MTCRPAGRSRAGTTKLIWGDNKLILSSLNKRAVDFDFESKREIVRVRKEWDPDVQMRLPGMEKPQKYLKTWEEVWTGDYVFENEWQSFRTKKDRSLEFKSVFRECPSGRRKIAVKVVDIFGNDTMKIVEVTIGREK